MANEPIQDTSLLLDAATAEARTAQAREAQSALKSRESVASPGSKYKGVPEKDAEDALAKAFEEATNTPAPKEGDEVPTSREITKAPGVPDSPAEPKTKTAEEIAAEAAAEARKEGVDTLDSLLATARTEPEVKPAAEEPKVVTETKAYEEHQLAPNASVKSKESFENLKKAAVERENTQRARAEAAEQRAQAAEAAVKEAQAKIGALPPEIDTELKELREHRALFATESDPTFKQKYDVRQAAQYEEIYGQLRLHSYPETEIEVLKSLSKAQRDREIDRLTGLLNEPSERRPIETRLAKIEAIEEEKATELAQTKARAAQIVKEQRDAPATRTAAKIDEVANLVKPSLKGLNWFFPKDIPAGTPPEAKKELEARNAFATQMQELLRSAIVDDTPQTRATAALSVPLSIYFRRELIATKAALDLANAKLEKIDKARATSRLSERSTPNAAVPPKATVDDDPQDAVDSLFKEASANAPTARR